MINEFNMCTEHPNYLPVAEPDYGCFWCWKIWATEQGWTSEQQKKASRIAYKRRQEEVRLGCRKPIERPSWAIQRNWFGEWVTQLYWDGSTHYVLDYLREIIEQRDADPADWRIIPADRDSIPEWRMEFYMDGKWTYEGSMHGTLRQVLAHNRRIETDEETPRRVKPTCGFQCT